MVTKRPNTAPTCGFIHILIMIATCCCLAATLLAVGFAACMQPVATDLFAKAFASNASSPYLDEDLQALARETRDYTVSDHGRSQGGSEAARQRIALATVLAAQHSADGDSPKRALWPDTAIDLLKKAQKDGMPEDLQKEYEQNIQKETDSFTKKVDELVAAKEKDILTV